MDVGFSARQHICYSALYAIARPSVRPSVTRMDQSKTVEVITQPDQTQILDPPLSMAKTTKAALEFVLPERYDGIMERSFNGNQVVNDQKEDHTKDGWTAVKKVILKRTDVMKFLITTGRQRARVTLHKTENSGGKGQRHL